MKKTVAFALTLVLALCVFAQPAFAYRYLFTDVDDTKKAGLIDLIENWYNTYEEGNMYELDIGDLAASGDKDLGNYGTVVSPTVPGGKPLRSYIINKDNEARTLNLLVSNEVEDIYPPEAPEKLVEAEFKQTVEKFEQIVELQKPEVDLGEMSAEFAQTYETQLDAVYKSFETYMTAAGFDGRYTASREDLSKLIYLAANYFCIGGDLTEALNDTVHPERYLYMCVELYKGILATFLDDEVSMEEFKSVMYIWQQADTDEDASISGAPYAFLTYDETLQDWVLVDVFQMIVVDDQINNGEVWDVIMDVNYFTLLDENAQIMALVYDEKAEQWKIAGMNTACFSEFLGIEKP